MSWSRVLAQAELDLPPLFRRKLALTERLDSLGRLTDPQARKELAWRLSLDFPGLGSIGALINLTAPERRSVLVGLPLSEPDKQFLESLVQRIDQDTALYASLGLAMPHSFPPPRLPDSNRTQRPVEADEKVESQKTPPSQASPHPRTPLPPLLSRLVVELRTGQLQPSLTLVDSVAGQFAEAAPDLQLQLQILSNGDIEATGVNQPEPILAKRDDGFIRPIRDQAHLDLADGSQLNGEMFGITSRRSVSDGSSTTRTWKGILSSWYWWKKEEVRYWVALSEAYFPRTSWNLDIEIIDARHYSDNIHITGTPSLTLVKTDNQQEKKNNKSAAAIVIESMHYGSDDKSHLLQMSIVLQAVCSVPIPKMFYGYNEAGEICAALQIGHYSAEVHDLGVPGAPCHFIPCLYADSVKDRHVWLVPFLRRLRSDVQRRVSQTMESLNVFRLATEEPIFEFRIDKLGKVIRMLLHSEGALRHDDYLNPSRVSAALRAFAKTRGIQLPAGAEEALELSHRLALLGARGASPNRLESSLDLSRMAAVNILRTAYASLIAGLVGYTGPLFLRIHPDRTTSELHYARRQPDPDDAQWDQAAAQERFEAIADAE